MKIMKSIDITGQVTEKIICNKCGNEITKDSYGNFIDWLEVNKRWGYSSDYDNLIHSFDICQNCYNKFIDEFKIKIK